MYSAQLLDHFQHPRNAGDISGADARAEIENPARGDAGDQERHTPEGDVGDVADADASVEIENPVCGDVIRLSLKVRDGRIAEIRFKAKGCVASMACASALTELVLGKSLGEARSLDRNALTCAVGGLPPASTHAAQLALDTLAAALRQVKA